MFCFPLQWDFPPNLDFSPNVFPPNSFRLNGGSCNGVLMISRFARKKNKPGLELKLSSRPVAYAAKRGYNVGPAFYAPLEWSPCPSLRTDQH